MTQSHSLLIKSLENHPISSLLWKNFLPAFIGVVVNSLYNVVDRIFIGQGVDALALSGLSAVFPVMIIQMAFGMLIGMGAGVRISINLGQRDYHRAEKVLGNAFVMLLLVSLIITSLGFAIKDPMLRLFGVSDATSKYANDYLNIVLFGSVFNVVGFSLNNLIRSEGNARTAMVSMMISAGANILLDPLFIFVFKMGVQGAALATVISQMLLCGWVLIHFRSTRSIIRLRLSNFRLDSNIVWYIISIGFAPFSMQLASSIVQGAYNMQLTKFGGDIAVGAMGIINSVSVFLVMTVIAINMAAQPIIGFNYGARHYRRVKETLITGIKAATLLCITGLLMIEIFPDPIIKVFNHDNSELLETGRNGMRILLAAMPLIGFQIIAGNFFQSTGKAGVAALLSLLRQVIILLPALMILPHFFNIQGVWLAGPVADTLSAIVVLFFLWREIKRLNVHIRYETRHLEKQ
ncbi:putative MATE family efflux protein [Breznakibacter xylanolyticus]|uniref:Multidrug export protein MepA n=1 Tax=Breznakibacter xylanolyticus TaxID=990 RepID=A0A2W7Q043_9BACT|nr:MATE family efflux transporter [Breznakibacter xylanolyticus]MBN2743596.1 MATE family efflux transporter [Marinilabiliaceae bacterium]PZX15149.1 putative MATE family efflux protein [Breznakibacter xylanolyticus]